MTSESDKLCVHDDTAMRASTRVAVHKENQRKQEVTGVILYLFLIYGASWNGRIKESIVEI